MIIPDKILLIIVVLIALIITLAIKINRSQIIISKNKDVLKQPNDLEKDYQFIKGLF